MLFLNFVYFGKVLCSSYSNTRCNEQLVSRITTTKKGSMLIMTHQVTALKTFSILSKKGYD